MKNLFGILDVNKFSDLFSDEDHCLAFLAEQKWKQGFVCRTCGHTNYCRGKSPHARRCTRCKHEESATAHTIFHRCHIPITEAFRIVYMVCSDPAVSTYEIARQVELRQMTCWKLKNKLTECMEKRGAIDLLYVETGDRVTR
jgi:two-component system, sensor histidine kinase LadS